MPGFVALACVLQLWQRKANGLLMTGWSITGVSARMSGYYFSRSAGRRQQKIVAQPFSGPSKATVLETKLICASGSELGGAAQQTIVAVG
jgi:hypothetical protein